MKQSQVNRNINFVNNKQLFVKQIKASYFRNYKNLELNLSSDNIVLSGLNGAGKTNILEAVSFLRFWRIIFSLLASTAERQSSKISRGGLVMIAVPPIIW